MNRLNRRVFLAGASALPAVGGAAWADEPGAAAAVAAECAAAAGEDRNLLLVFYANWCVYCRLFDAMLADKQAGGIIEKHYRVYHLRALEREDTYKAQQLAGADDLFNTYAPKGAGLPYMAVLDAGAAKVTDSIMPKDKVNFGFPVTRDELDWFEGMMKAGAPAITPKELKVLRRTCVEVMKQKA